MLADLRDTIAVTLMGWCAKLATRQYQRELAEYIKASNLTRVHVYEYEAMMYMHSNSSAGERIRGGFDLAFGELLDMVGEDAAAAPLLTSRVFKRHKVGFNPFELMTNAEHVRNMLSKHPEWAWMALPFEEQLKYLDANVHTRQDEQRE